MTTADFNLACTDIHFFTINSNVLDCPGRRAYGCPKCVFNSKSTSYDDDCYIQDRDKLTPKQLAKLQSNYPELFL